MTLAALLTSDGALSIAQAVIVAIASFIGSYAALRVELKYLRLDVDQLKKSNARAHERIEDHVRDFHIPHPPHRSRGTA